MLLACKWACFRHVHPVDPGNWRRSQPKTWIPAATLGRPPLLRSGLLSDHFGKGCWHVVPRLFRLAPVSGRMNHRLTENSRVIFRESKIATFSVSSQRRSEHRDSPMFNFQRLIFDSSQRSAWQLIMQERMEDDKL